MKTATCWITRSSLSKRCPREGTAQVPSAFGMGGKIKVDETKEWIGACGGGTDGADRETSAWPFFSPNSLSRSLRFSLSLCRPQSYSTEMKNRGGGGGRRELDKNSLRGKHTGSRDEGHRCSALDATPCLQVAFNEP